MAATRKKRGRPVAVADCGLGLLLMVVPSRIAALVAGGGTPPEARIIRLLGARMVGQGAVLLLRPTVRMRRLGAAVDAAHGSSMVGLAVLSRRYRRPAAASAAIAGASAWLEVASTLDEPA
jgi:hypothetical protein